jgi:integrase
VRWVEAVELWKRRRQHLAPRSVEEEDRIFRRLSRLDGLDIEQITSERIEDLADELLRDLAPRTVNHHLAAIRKVLRRAQARGKLAQAPEIRLLPVPRRSFLPPVPAKLQRFLGLLQPHQRWPTEFALETGLRKSNVARLEWSNVDLAGRRVMIAAGQMKARRTLVIPLTPLALAILTAQTGHHRDRVFTWRGRPIEELNTRSWRAARSAAGLDGYRWHDLRHTWASWHAMAGTPLLALMELGGWASLDIVKTYAHFDRSHLQGYADAFSEWRRQA